MLGFIHFIPPQNKQLSIFNFEFGPKNSKSIRGNKLCNDISNLSIYSWFALASLQDDLEQNVSPTQSTWTGYGKWDSQQAWQHSYCHNKS